MNNHDPELPFAQQEICQKYGSTVVLSDPELKVGFALNSLGQMPIHGVRSTMAGDTTGWYIYAGEYSDATDFFVPVCTSHLVELLPAVLKYLSLAPGFSFIIDDNGYEDVWFDQKRLDRESTYS
jgi:hypothetical protein